MVSGINFRTGRCPFGNSVFGQILNLIDKSGPRIEKQRALRAPCLLSGTNRRLESERKRSGRPSDIEGRMDRPSRRWWCHKSGVNETFVGEGDCDETLSRIGKPIPR